MSSRSENGTVGLDCIAGFGMSSLLSVALKINARCCCKWPTARAAAVYGKVIGVPRGGLRLAAALLPYERLGYPLLIVDDVLTTGISMQEMRDRFPLEEAIGVVIFARGQCPDWIRPIFTVSE